MLFILIGYMFLFIHRPFEIWPPLEDVYLERFYMLGALLALAMYTGKRWIPNRQHLAYFGFAAAVLLCWVASPWINQGHETVANYFKMLVFYVLIVLVIHDELSLRRLLMGFLLIMSLYMTHSLREYRNGRHVYRMKVERLIGVDETMGDPNTFGATIVFALPFVVPFWRDRPSRRLRWFLAGYVALSTVCIGLTGSRSAFVGLLLFFVLTILKSRWRLRLAILGVLCAPLLWMALPDSLQNRFETIIHPEVGPASAIESGKGRLEGLRMGFKLWGTSPITGWGPGAWKRASGSVLESHNLYGQLLGEMGLVGAVAFLAILLCFWMNLRWIRRTYQQHPEWGQDFLFHCAGAVATAVLLLLFEGIFGHNLFRYSWVWYGGFLTIARYCVEQRLNMAGEPAWPEFSSVIPIPSGYYSSTSFNVPGGT